MRVAILGSSFDPPHIGHLLIAHQVTEHLDIDQIWFMPAYKHAFGKKLTPVKHRLAMIKLCESDVIKTSELEIKRKEISYTIDTLKELEHKYPKNIFSWILGSDQLDEFQKYKDWKEIVKYHSLIIFPRESILNQLAKRVKQKLQLSRIPHNITILDNNDLILTNISSSMVRDRVKKGLSIKHLVTLPMEEYISSHKLYAK